MTRPKLDDLAKHQQILEQRLQLLEQIFAMQGIALALWLSPANAGKILGISRDRLLWEIERAEQLRILGRQGDVKYNQHYRNIQNPEAETATWQIHLVNMQKILAIPPEERRIG